MADQLLLVVQSEISGRGAAGDDERPRLEPFIVSFNPDMLVARIEIGHFRVRKPGAKFLGLPVHVQNQLRSIDSVGKPGIIFYKSRRRELPTGLTPFQHQWAEVCPCRVNSGSQPGATAPNNDHLLHR
jgi:hypothetical protein